MVEAISDLLQEIDIGDRDMLTDPRHYNIRWLELMNELSQGRERFGTAL